VNGSTDRIRDLAARIVEADFEGRRHAEVARSLAKVFERLHDILAPMVGELGYAAVMKRAVWLAARTADAAGFPAETGLAERDLIPMVEGAGAARAVRWAEQIVEQAISLLHSFLGAPLTMRLIERAFPPHSQQATPRASKLIKEGQDE
jgi:hypothetical protein